MKYIIFPVIAVVALLSGCRYGCTPYDNCGPVFANPQNCNPNYRSGSVFNNVQQPQMVEGQLANPSEATGPATGQPTAIPSAVPSTVPAPTATPAPTTIPGNGEMDMNNIQLEEIPVSAGINTLPAPNSNAQRINTARR